MSYFVTKTSSGAEAEAFSGYLPVAAEPMPQWFAVYTTARHEKRVAQHFQQRGMECFLPLYEMQRKWRNGLRITIELPLFPNYLFVHVDRRTQSRVLSVPGVLSIVGGRSPTPLWDTEVASLRAGCSLRKFEPHPYLISGQRIRIKSGCLAGLQGILVQSRSNRMRAVVTIQQIMRSVAVELENDQVELLPGDEWPVAFFGVTASS